MKHFIIDLFKIETKPRKGLLALEWAVLAYLVLTTLVILFTYTRLENPESMLWGRLRIVAMTMGLWIVYRLVPCKLTQLARVLAQFGLLAWWYPDTYEINRIFPNLDHWFATCEQQLFGFQPSVSFSQVFSSPIISELMDLGYVSYYPMMVFLVLFYFFYDYKNFQRCAFVIIASFMVYYVIYDFLPVVGPTFYFKAIGMDSVSKGIFPAVGHYFNTHTDCFPSPGYPNGLFYQLVESAKEAGERPTAAFPSSHVGISTVCMLLAWRTQNRWLFWTLMPFFAFLCMATVYIQAHYAIDTIAGFVTAIAFYFIFWAKFWHKNEA